MKRAFPYRSLLFQLLLLASLFLFQDVGAQILYVGPNETYTNIKWALGQANDGDTIIVKDSVYVEDIKVRVSVVLMAENLHGAVIGDGSGTLAMISIIQAATDGVVIDGFKFVDYDRPGIIVGDGDPANGVKNCVIRNNYIENRRIGIRVAATSTNLEISGNTITGSIQHGVHHLGVGDNLISDNTLENCGESGIVLPAQHMGSFTISNNKIRQSVGNGIEIARSDVVIEGNIIDGNQIGINVTPGCTGIVVRDSNQVINNSEGLVIEGEATIENNDISGNLDHGIISQGFTSITGNRIDSNNGFGILLQTGSAEIENNQISSNEIHGIEVGSEMDDVEITENNIIENNRSGIMLFSSATINGNTINRNKEYGIFTQLGSAIITNNQINSNGIHGIEVGRESGSVVISDNEISSNSQVGVMTFIGAVLTGNFIDGNGEEGILIPLEASDVVITGQNQIKANRTGISVFGSALINDNIISENLEYGIWIEEPAEQVTLTWNRVEDNNTAGVVILSGTGDVLIKENVISNNVRGLYSAGEPKLRENTIQHNTEYGIKIRLEGIDLGGRIEADSEKNAILDNGWNVINRDSVEIQAIGNYWGTNDAAEIDSTIMDNDEDSLTGPVIFEPFLTDYNVGVQKPYPGEDSDDHGMLKVYPNPVHGNATIQFRLLAAGEVDLCVISTSGRVLQSLVSGRYYEPGEHRIQWDGFPGDGRVTPDGIYFVVMKVGQQLVSRKILLMK